MDANSEARVVTNEFRHKDSATTSFVFSLISLAVCAVPLLSIGGIVFGAVALNRAVKNKTYALDNDFKEHGLNAAARIIGLISLIVSSLFTLIYLLVLIAGIFIVTDAVNNGLASTMHILLKQLVRFLPPELRMGASIIMPYLSEPIVIN